MKKQINILVMEIKYDCFHLYSRAKNKYFTSEVKHITMAEIIY